LDGRIFQIGMKKTYDQIWALWNQFGDKRVFINVMGKEPVMLTAREIRGKYDIVPAGTADNSNRSQQAQKAFFRLQLLRGDPLIRQDELLRDFLEKDDPVTAVRLLKTEDELAEEQGIVADQTADDEQKRTSPTIDQAIEGVQAAKKAGAKEIRQ